MRRSTLGFLAILGCGGAGTPAPRVVEAAAPAPTPIITAPPPFVAAPVLQPELVITLAPKAVPTPHVDVFLTARTPAKPLVDWTFAKVAFDALSGPVLARDADGPIRYEEKPDGAKVHLHLARAPKGAVHLDYSIAAAAQAYPSPPPVVVDPDRFDAPGEAILAVPDNFDELAVKVALRIDAGELGANNESDAASTFGVGASRDGLLRGRDLTRTFFLAGQIGKAIFEGPEGHDEGAWLGYTTFDPRVVVADVASFRTATRQLFHAGQTPLTLLTLVDKRPSGAFVASRRAASVLLRVGVGEPWSGPVRVAVATELVHEWIGGALWIGPVDDKEAEAFWFSEGVARFVARDLLFRWGLMTPAEVASEVEGLESLALLSPRKGESNAELASHVREPNALPLIVARGDLYATRLDAELRKKKKGGLLPVLQSLYEEAAKTHGPLPAATWMRAVATAMDDPKEERAFVDEIARGKHVDLPDGALGPCFARVKKTFEETDLGFDERATIERGIVTGLAAGGPAARAGLREGDHFVALDRRAGHADKKVAVVVKREAETSIEYVPASTKTSGFGWSRKHDVADDACVK